MKLYFYNRKRYPSKENPAYYNVTRGYAGYTNKLDDVCVFEGTEDEFEKEYLDQSRPQTQHRKGYGAWY